MGEHTNLFAQSMQNSDIDCSILDLYLDAFLELSMDIRDQCILKGNVLLNKLAPDLARATKDLDMSVANLELYEQCIKPRLIIWAQRMVDAKLASSFVLKDASTQASGGVSLYSQDKSLAFSIDISIYKASRYGALKYTFSGNDIWASSPEKILCDKLLATLSNRRIRRLKDFYDLYVLKYMNTSYDFSKVKELALEKYSLIELQRLVLNYPFTLETVRDLRNAWNKFSLTSFDQKIVLKKPDLLQLLQEIGDFYERFQEILSI